MPLDSRQAAPGGGNGAAVRFAMSVYARFGVNYFARNADNLLVGWRFNAQALGFYKKAYDLFALSANQLVAPLSNVAVSALSRLNRDSAQIQEISPGALWVTAFVGMGIGGILRSSVRTSSAAVGARVGAGWAHLHVFRARYRGHVSLLHPRLDSPLHRPASLRLAEEPLSWESPLPRLCWLCPGDRSGSGAWTVSFWVLTLPAFQRPESPSAWAGGEVVAAGWRYPAASLLAGFWSG